MADDRLKRLEERLAAMNATSDELRQSLETRANARETLQTLQTEARRQADEQFSDAVGDLETRLSTLRDTQKTEHADLLQMHDAELNAFDALTEEMETRRKNVKADYGDLHEALGQFRKLTEAEAPAATEG